MADKKHKPHSGDKWKYHDGDAIVVKPGIDKLTTEQQAGYDAVVKAARESIKRNKHQQ
ncbi:hypothetical protein [Fructilactobacillus frigidiflavus]|uniref:hypothetical protein n=1 Tax=Fructilactobacillus frigidiflavus TaxID=3242688 RepID=UPI003758407D